jgi:FAD-dependent urate hydroxylase
MTRETVDVGIIGAGPYGLSLAAHLRAAGVHHRVFGEPMRLWRSHMPVGMFLKSQGFASNLSTPDADHTLEAFCKDHGHPYVSYGVPIPLETFVAYGDWFQRAQVPELEEVLVQRVVSADTGGRYILTLADGRSVSAKHVVVAVGVQHFAHIPDVLAALPSQLHSHTSRHSDLGPFHGRDVVVVGAGQSALESAALLHEAGAAVRVLARGDRLQWNGQPLPPNRPWWARLREPEVNLGSGWATWFYSTHAALFRHLPSRQRLHRARTALGPAGAHWLKPRIEGHIPVHLGQEIIDAQPVDNGVRLLARTRDRRTVALHTEHVIAATGYRADIGRVMFLDPALRTQLRTIGRTPHVGRTFESSLSGLYFVGPAVAPTFGPVMRFVCGTDFASRQLSRHFAAAVSRPVAIVSRPRG